MVRLTDSHDMTLAVKHGLKTTTQQQHDEFRDERANSVEPDYALLYLDFYCLGIQLFSFWSFN